MKNGGETKRVLVVAYDFPPRRTSGVYRTTRLTRYLYGLGWIPTVLTVERRETDFEDSTLLEGFPPQIAIERVNDLNISGWEETAAQGIRATGGLRSSGKSVRQPLQDRWIRAAGDLMRSVFYFPDEFIGWVPASLMRAVELNLRCRFDLVYTTSPPRSTPIVGLLLKMLFGIPWVAEFRDPWYPRPRPLRRRFEHGLFRIMVKKADRIIVISSGHAQLLTEKFHVPSTKINLICNGFEETDFISHGNEKCDFLPDGFFHISHFGMVYQGFSGRFFEALADLMGECPELASHVRINIIGFPDGDVRKALERDVLREVVQLHPFVPHGVAIDAMRRSDILLLFLGNRDVARLSGVGKIYDYLRVGRPVLAVAYEGGTAEVVREGGIGWVLNPEDAGAIRERLRSILQVGENGPLPPPASREYVEKFRFDRLAKELTAVFELVREHD